MEIQIILAKMKDAFRFLEEDWGFMPVFNGTGDYGPLLLFQKNQVQIKIQYDMRESELRIQKITLDENGKPKKYLHASNVVQNILNNKEIISLMRIHTDEELDISLQRWVTIFQEHKTILNES